MESRDIRGADEGAGENERRLAARQRPMAWPEGCRAQRSLAGRFLQCSSAGQKEQGWSGR